jgi:carbamoyltransferase
MITWGLVGNSHDASLAVFNNDKLEWAALAKDFSRVPNDPHLNSELIKYALDIWGGPSRAVWYERPLLKTLRQWQAGQGWLYKENNIRSYLGKYIGYRLPIKYTQHHHSHAAYAYYTQPHDDCAVICLDSIGEFETLTIWHGKNNRLKKIYSQGYPHSLGLFYSAMTQRMGLVPQRDEYLVAQWAKQGDPHRLSQTILKEIIDVDHAYKNSKLVNMRENLHRGCMWWRPELVTQQDMYDIAAATQAIFVYAVNVLSIWAKVQTNSPNIALAGGGALNREAVNSIRAHWDNVWVPNNPGDPGSCIGAVLAQTKTKTNIDRVWHKAV